MGRQAKVVCNNIWKVFGTNPERTMQTLDRSLSRSEVQEQTNHVIAVKDVSFKVQEGETFVVMGLSGSGKSRLAREVACYLGAAPGARVVRTDVSAGIDEALDGALATTQRVDRIIHLAAQVSVVAL